MNILNFHQNLIKSYKAYIQSFLNVKDNKIFEIVQQKINEQKLWPEPLVQFNPTFEKGKSFQELIESEHLHPELNKIFTGYQLYKHQEDAITIGAKEKEFIVTSGTGSGKSLTYMATIFNYILNNQHLSENKTKAVIVYPMNALINSQFIEIQKFKDKWEDSYKTPFPIIFDQYTGQENQEKRNEMQANPPHILLTNYMMLELIMTRGGKETSLRTNILENIHFLVFDELHTYRGRQGSDVSMLIRRIKTAAKDKNIICIGTSATMVSDDSSSLLAQKEKVAETASTIFGSNIESSQIVNESLTKSLSSNVLLNQTTLKETIYRDIDIASTLEVFLNHPTAHWIEENIALEPKEGIFTRRKPITIPKISEKLALDAGVSTDEAKLHVQKFLEWANIINAQSGSSRDKKFLPYRIHQFISQTGSVYATLGNQTERQIFLDIGRYADSGDTLLYPIVFSRASGHELYCVRINQSSEKILPREFYEAADEDDENVIEEGYIFIEHEDDNEPVWNPERDMPELPESWFSPERKDGTRGLKKEKLERLPKKIYFDVNGNYSFDQSQFPFHGWYISFPLMIDPTSGSIYEGKTSEWTKVMKLGGEGRSTATTVLSFETIKQLKAEGESIEKQKLLSFTDNRQDASLQAGHFNDFIKVGQLRAAIVKALEKDKVLDYSNIADKIFESLNVPQEKFAKYPASFPGPKKENEDTFKNFIMYRLLHDLRRSWRVVLPNLEQCGLLEIHYKHLDESVSDDNLWQPNELLSAMTPEKRKEFLFQVFEFFRKSFALDYTLLESSAITQNEARIKEKLKHPWTLDSQEKIEVPNVIRVEKLPSKAGKTYSASVGIQSMFARYIKKNAAESGISIQGKENYNTTVYKLFDFLTEAGWLKKDIIRGNGNENISVYKLNISYILWQVGKGNIISIDRIKQRAYKEQLQKPNEYFREFYKTDFNSMKPVEGNEHTGQINSETRKQREELFRNGDISALFCSPTMELGIDISDLSVVHMRNVPPSPSNYAQRSGRAGRSGQAALVMVYCANFNAHDRHYFKHAQKMVAGVVTAPRLDLLNEELLASHLNALILSKKPIDGLNDSFEKIIDKSNVENLYLKDEVIETLKMDDAFKQSVLSDFKAIISDVYFKNEMLRRKPHWFNDDWIMMRIDRFLNTFDEALNRWRKLYRLAQKQILQATNIIENRIYGENHEKKIEARRILYRAERERDLLLNDSGGGGTGASVELSEFYPFRYLAAEGFLPGYNFTRLPVRTFLENKDSGGEYVSRPRFVALNEFGPRNVIYHDGAQYLIDRLMVPEAELKLQKGKICPKTGYFLFDNQYNFEVDPIINEPLQLDSEKHVHTTLIEMAETRAYEVDRITCQQEERTRKGYEIQTYFAVDGGFENSTEGLVSFENDKLLHIHYFPSCRIFKLNLKWRASRENGFAINLLSGYWQSKKKKEEEGDSDNIKDVKIFTSNTANSIYIQPVDSLKLQGGKKGVITLMYALKQAIENYFQAESNEIGATIMGDDEAPNILIYEAAEGSLGILSQIVDNPDVYKAVVQEAYELCFYKDGIEVEGKVLPATYDDLLSYYNQFYHESIDRNLIREALLLMQNSSLETISNRAFDSYHEQFHFLQAARDQNSSTEEKFLTYLYQNGLKLPDEAQPAVKNMYVRPDFFYKPNVFIFCDGTPHDKDSVKNDDFEKRKALINSGYQVLSWHYLEPIENFIKKRPDIFKKIK